LEVSAIPRLTHSNPTYRKHRASGQAVVTIDGRCFYLGPWKTKSSKIEYDRIIGEWLGLPYEWLPWVKSAITLIPFDVTATSQSAHLCCEWML